MVRSTCPVGRGQTGPVGMHGEDHVVTGEFVVAPVQHRELPLGHGPLPVGGGVAVVARVSGATMIRVSQ